MRPLIEIEVAIVLLTVLLMTIGIGGWVAREIYAWIQACARRAAGRCHFCGYDLSGQRTMRCPECGGSADWHAGA